MNKKMIGTMGILLALSACHSTQKETILETFRNEPVPDWVQNPGENKIKEEAFGRKVFVDEKTVPWSDKGWSFQDNPIRLACVSAIAQEKASIGQKIDYGQANQKIFWIKAKQADGKIVLHAFCRDTWKKLKPQVQE